MNGWAIFGIVIGVIIVACGIGAAIYFFVYRVRMYEKMYKDVKAKYDMLNSRLMGQDLQYITRLENIAGTNLLYTETYNRFEDRFKEIRNKYDVKCDEALYDLKYLFEATKYVEFVKKYREVLPLFTEFEKAVNELDKDLHEVIHPEEEARDEISKIKERFRTVRARYFEEKLDESFIEETLEEIFESIEKKFNEYDSYIDSARYDYAKELVPELQNSISELADIVDAMPRWVKEISDNVPNRIDGLKETYKELVEKGYQLQTIGIEEITQNLRYHNDILRKDLLELNLENINKDLAKIYDQITETEGLFFEEVDDKYQFDINIKDIVSRFIASEKRILKLKNNIPTVKKYYVVGADYDEIYDSMMAKLEEATAEKRKLDSQIEKLKEVMYKTVVPQMELFDEKTKELEDSINEYKDFVKKLKTDAEKAYYSMIETYKKLKLYEGFIKEVIIEENRQGYLDIITKSYEYLDRANEVISVIPIDVATLNKIMNEMNEIIDSLYIDIDERLNFKTQAEKLILICNRDCYKFNDVNLVIQEAENAFFNYDYEKAYEQALIAKETINKKNGINTL